MTDQKTKIGKDVIESLTLGMYENPLIIYREYIQNSADQIDIAKENGTIKENESKIDIKINRSGKRISFYDNATGVSNSKVNETLKSIAQGIKDRDKHKGFRGIGRLGGLAYCDELVFETSYYGEDSRSILTWNAKKLKEIINDRKSNEDASSVIDEITTFETENANSDERYFKVIMKNVSNSELLDKEVVEEYLKMVAPIPYHKGFHLSEKIYTFIEKNKLSIDEYNIFLNTQQLFKAYTTRIYGNDKKRVDEVFDLIFFQERLDKQILYWGWYSVSTFSKQIPSYNVARGLRLRKANIQIGDSHSLVRFFKEQRGSFYFFGEVFATHNGLIPNARRDYFTENDFLKKFELSLRAEFKELSSIYRLASDIRGKVSSIKKHKKIVKEYKEKDTNSGFTNKDEKKAKLDEIDRLKEKAEEAKRKLTRINEKLNDKSKEKKIYDKIISKKDIKVDSFDTSKQDKKTKYCTDDLTKYSKKERKLISKIFSIIDDSLVSQSAENLKNIIKEKLK